MSLYGAPTAGSLGITLLLVGGGLHRYREKFTNASLR